MPDLHTLPLWQIVQQFGHPPGELTPKLATVERELTSRASQPVQQRPPQIGDYYTPTRHKTI
jgi:hypothetical protein